MPNWASQSAGTYVFDIRAWVDGDHVTMLDTEVMADDTVDSSTAFVELLIGQDD